MLIKIQQQQCPLVALLHPYGKCTKQRHRKRKQKLVFSPIFSINSPNQHKESLATFYIKMNTTKKRTLTHQLLQWLE